MTNAPWVIEFVSGQLTQQVRLTEPVIVGRADNKGEYKPDIDLEPYGGEEKGVSRRHLKISLSDNQLQVTDLQSNNGSSLNGEKMDSPAAAGGGHRVDGALDVGGTLGAGTHPNCRWSR
jgi:pSer/pThr/pTyr-binding forkhead associated (FHA) protein